jgi:hypothetical protein
MIRVLLIGLDLVRERTIHLPMQPHQIELLSEIRRGEVVLADLLTLSEKLENDLLVETDESDLPDSANYEVMNDLLGRVRYEHLAR